MNRRRCMYEITKLFALLFSEGVTCRQRRRRTAFTNEQLDRLEDAFEKERFPGIQIREDLSRELNIGEDRIQVNFYNCPQFAVHYSLIGDLLSKETVPLVVLRWPIFPGYNLTLSGR